MKRIIFALLLAVTSIYCSGQDYIDWVSSQSQAIRYGYLYNWYAISDTRNLANTGWHVATKAEYRTLADYLGAAGDYNTNSSGGKLKETGTTYWNSPNTGATNETFFNGRGSGSRSSTGLFSGNKTICDMWTATIVAGTTAELAFLSNVNATLNVNSSSNVLLGKSARLIKDSTTLTNGQSGTYTGNDGKVYRTICIGTQEWLADNLAETKYRNGDAIPEVTDNTAWSALTTGARCVYNNDESNR